MAAEEAGDGAESKQEGEQPPEGEGKELTKEEFFGIFKKEQSSIRQDLSKVESGDHVNEELDALLSRVQALEESFTRVAHILPAYDVQQYRTQSKEMAAEVAARREQLAPRKKFAFKKKSPAAGSAGKAAGEAPAAGPRPTSSAASASAAVPAAAFVNAGEVFEGLSREAVVRSREALSGQDVTLRNLDGCLVVLLGRVGALNCHELRGCRIFVGAVGSSALLYSCSDCVITLAAKQLRLHDSTRMLFHLHTLSGPVVEHCKRIAFAPFDLSYPGGEDDLSTSALGTPATGESGGAWCDVQDFNWHKRQASPNWCLLPADCRRERVVLPDAQTAAQAASPLPPALGELARCRGCWEAAESAAQPSPAQPAGGAAAGAAAGAAEAPAQGSGGCKEGGGEGGGLGPAPGAIAAAASTAASAAADASARLDSDDEF